jgi:hypothetical protein
MEQQKVPNQRELGWSKRTQPVFTKPQRDSVDSL